MALSEHVCQLVPQVKRSVISMSHDHKRLLLMGYLQSPLFSPDNGSAMLSCYGLTGHSNRNGFLESKAQQCLVGPSQAKSFGADLEGNKNNHSSSRARSRLQTKSSLRLDSRYNAAFIQVQTVLRKRYISRYVS